jgi:LAO/AO transport system kinase
VSASQRLDVRVLAGDPRAIARAISLIEDNHPATAALIRALFPHTGRATLVGITGPPGAGKSTLVDRLVTDARSAGERVGVIAVDPTSPFTGGSILGDRIRMQAHAADKDVFIRSMATRGHLGGLARTTSDAALVLDAAGKSVVIVETVGVGQDEVDIVGTADVSIVVLVPEAGDDVQAIKAGIMEIGDIFVVNKADREGADRMAQAVSAALSLQTVAAGQWRPPVLKTSASTGEGIDALWDAVQRFGERPPVERAARTRARHAAHLRELLVQQLLRRTEQALPAGRFDTLVDRIAAREIDPYAAAADIMRGACDEPGVARTRATGSSGGCSTSRRERCAGAGSSPKQA